MRHVKLTIQQQVLCLALAVLGQPAHALPEDRNLPIHIQADSADFDQQAGSAVYRGQVVMTQGTIRLTGDVIKLRLKNQAVVHLQAEGTERQPATYSETLEAEGKGKPDRLSAHGASISYDRTGQQLLLTGKARLEQGSRFLTGDRVEYNQQTGRALARGGSGQDGRVRMAFQPKASGTKEGTPRVP